jgi:hypothetical protein
MPAKTKESRASGVTVTWTKSGGLRMKAYGPNTPALRTLLPCEPWFPGLLGAKGLWRFFGEGESASLKKNLGD